MKPATDSTSVKLFHWYQIKDKMFNTFHTITQSDASPPQSTPHPLYPLSWYWTALLNGCFDVVHHLIIIASTCHNNWTRRCTILSNMFLLEEMHATVSSSVSYSQTHLIRVMPTGKHALFDSDEVLFVYTLCLSDIVCVCGWNVAIYNMQQYIKCLTLLLITYCIKSPVRRI